MATALRPVGHEDRLSLVEHLDELRTRLIVSLFAFLVFFALCLRQRDRVLDAVNRTHETGAPFREEYRLLHAEGRDVWVLDETQAVADEQGKPLFLQGFLLDVSDRYRRRAF